MIKIILTILISLLSFNQRNSFTLIAGSDTRSYDISATEQSKLLKRGLGNDVKVFRFNVSNYDLNNHIKNQKFNTIILFSAGCRKTFEVVKNPYVDARKVFVIEPYAVDSEIRTIIRNAVNNGLPKENIFVGPNRDRGLGVLGSERLPSSQSIGHLEALESVGRIIKNR
jgi:hypothetical protein